jgi:anti-sigma-K factor RskA
MSPGQDMFETHDCGGDAAAYVLGALEPAEADRFRRHLEACAVCRDEVESLSGVVQALPMAAPQHPLPRRLRRRVLREVRAEQLPHAASRRRPRPLLLGGLATAGAAVAALAIAVVLAVSTGGTSARVIQAQVLHMAGSAQLRVTGTRAELVVHQVAPPPSGHVYEVWLKAGHAAPVPANVLFSVSATGGADVTLPRSLRGVSQVMVTPEPDGGSPSPTHAPVIVATLS